MCKKKLDWKKSRKLNKSVDIKRFYHFIIPNRFLSLENRTNSVQYRFLNKLNRMKLEPNFTNLVVYFVKIRFSLFTIDSTDFLLQLILPRQFFFSLKISFRNTERISAWLRFRVKFVAGWWLCILIFRVETGYSNEVCGIRYL